MVKMTALKHIILALTIILTAQLKYGNCNAVRFPREAYDNPQFGFRHKRSPIANFPNFDELVKQKELARASETVSNGESFDDNLDVDGAFKKTDAYQGISGSRKQISEFSSSAGRPVSPFSSGGNVFSTFSDNAREFPDFSNSADTSVFTDSFTGGLSKFDSLRNISHGKGKVGDSWGGGGGQKRVEIEDDVEDVDFDRLFGGGGKRGDGDGHDRGGHSGGAATGHRGSSVGVDDFDVEEIKEITHVDEIAVTSSGIAGADDVFKDNSNDFTRFCDKNPTTLPFKFLPVTRKFSGYFVLAHDKADLETLKELITGRSSCLDIDDKPCIRLTINTAGDEYTLTGFGGQSATVVCSENNLKETKSMCLAKLAGFNFSTFITLITDDKTRAVALRCYDNGKQGYFLLGTENTPLTDLEKRILRSHVKKLGFNSQDIFYSNCNDNCKA